MKTISKNDYTFTFSEPNENKVLVSIHPKFVTGKEELIMQYVSEDFSNILVNFLEK